MYSIRTLLTIGLTTLTLLSCTHEKTESVVEPEPEALAPCASGVVLQTTCMDGLLIEVDSQYPIGRDFQVPIPGSTVLVGRNAVAAINEASIPAAYKRIGKRIFFRYQSATCCAPRPCTQDRGPVGATFVIISNVDSVACR